MPAASKRAKEHRHAPSVCRTIFLALKDSLEATMFGYGLLGTLLVIALIVWIIRRL
jgi:hypothetical protein